MSLAFYASPIDFSKNEKTDKKSKKPKLDLNALRQMTQPKEEEISKIHEKVEDDIKQENDTILSDYYAKEVEENVDVDLSKEEIEELFKSYVVFERRCSSASVRARSARISLLSFTYS